MDAIVAKIRNNIERLRTEIDHIAREAGRESSSIELCAVTKYATTTETAAVARALHELGLPVRLGESRVQDLLPKAAELQNEPCDVHWDLIGTLQRNKARSVVRVFDRIHSLDRISILDTLDRLATEFGLVAAGVPIRGLLQVRTSDEETKRGFSIDEVERALDHARTLEGLRIEGFMTMAPRGTDHETARPWFAELRRLRDRIAPDLEHLSMGMSQDYRGAIREGATIVRLGSALHATGG
ncbi:MAG: YggS family pyridoxal phosphate-dependent enzyme [Planctomycetes bacterium]|nr:YggS family pyridoxal phosphate-dependent enzyme [Planctomycetota bacterium]MCB9918062.1 YggS family pyridoxal phosphate-dependent enzyme [Planctomycetota bacterium]